MTGQPTEQGAPGGEASTVAATAGDAGGAGGEAVIRAYLDAVAARDLDDCIDLFEDDAVFIFVNARFTGKPQIREWHQERFVNEMEITKIDAIKTLPDGSVILDGAITSKRLRTWKINTLSGRATFFLAGDKIREAKLGLRPYNPFDGW